MGTNRTAAARRAAPWMAAACAAWGWAGAAAAGDGVSGPVLAALERGHGTTCSLDNRPVDAGGYYPCVDIGPYRFVRGYGALTGFVVVPDGAPFPIFLADDGGERFLARGEWTGDLARRVSAWYADEVEGGRVVREGDEASRTRLREAEEAVRRQSGAAREAGAAGVPPVGAAASSARPLAARPPFPQAPAQPYPYAYPPAAAAAPTVPAPATEEPPTGTPGSGALRASPIPTRPPAAGRELAPGVVQLPSGAPYGAR